MFIKNKKSIIFIVSILLLSLFSTSLVSANNIDKNNLEKIDMNGYRYNIDAEYMEDVVVSLEGMSRKNSTLSGKITVQLKEEDWFVNLDSIEKDQNTYTSNVMFFNENGEEREGDITLDVNFKFVSGYIESYEDPILFTSGPESIDISSLKNHFKQREIGKYEENEETITTLTSSDEYIRSTINTSFIYSHVVGPSSLGSGSNYQKYSVRGWLKSVGNGDDSVRYYWHYVEPWNYASGGLSVDDVFPKSVSNSTVSVRVFYKGFFAQVNIPVTSTSYEVKKASGTSWFREYRSGAGFSESTWKWPGNWTNQSGLAGDFYIVMMGGSTSGTWYRATQTARFGIYDRWAKAYYYRQGDNVLSIQAK